jgi:hypothetical protein
MVDGFMRSPIPIGLVFELQERAHSLQFIKAKRRSRIAGLQEALNVTGMNNMENR